MIRTAAVTIALAAATLGLAPVASASTGGGCTTGPGEYKGTDYTVRACITFDGTEFHATGTVLRQGAVPCNRVTVYFTGADGYYDTYRQFPCRTGVVNEITFPGMGDETWADARIIVDDYEAPPALSYELADVSAPRLNR